MTRRGFSARVGAVALMASVLMVIIGATAAGSTTTTTPGHAAPFTAKLGPTNPDPSCPHAPDFPEVNFRQNFAGIAKTRIGPAIIANSVCYIFDGAMGGSVLKGTFALVTIAGTLRGTSSGVVGYGANDHYQLTLTVTSGTLFLSHVRGTITLDARTTPDWSAVTGTLTSGLYLPWGWGHHLPIPLA